MGGESVGAARLWKKPASCELTLPSPITLGLLCGGQGRRLGGPKEQLIDAGGQSLLEAQVARLRPHFEQLLLLSGPSHKELPGAPGVPDPEPFAGRGPLAGLLAGLEAASHDWLALLPLDQPYFPPEAFRMALARHSCSASPRAIGFLDPTGRRQWLPGLYHRKLRKPLRQALAGGVTRFGEWVETVQPTFIEWAELYSESVLAFCNLNSPEQAAAAGYRLPWASKT